MALSLEDVNVAETTGREAGRPTFGFGVPATSSPHHFKVVIPGNSQARVKITEDLGLQAKTDDSQLIDRVVLDRTRWTAIRGEVQRAFNVSLAAHGMKPSAWKVGENLVDRLLGKELCVLAWAVEEMELEKIPVAVRNWLALRQEERWWLFGMTALSTGRIGDAGKGWRAALKHALGDIAQSEQLAPRGRRRRRAQAEVAPSLELFGDEES
jgi:hypothetical protein